MWSLNDEQASDNSTAPTQRIDYTQGQYPDPKSNSGNIFTTLTTKYVGTPNLGVERDLKRSSLFSTFVWHLNKQG